MDTCDAGIGGVNTLFPNRIRPTRRGRKDVRSDWRFGVARDGVHWRNGLGELKDGARSGFFQNDSCHLELSCYTHGMFDSSSSFSMLMRYPLWQSGGEAS